MSANTSIKEGGQARSFGPVVALMVLGSDGKYYPWVPESERQLDTLSVTKNGIYQAKKLGVYGWRSVSVNVPTDGSVTGKDPETGQQVTVGVDPTTGELTETVVPVEIRVTVPPTKTEYSDGEAINFSGLVVHAYDANGGDMGAVPFGELVFPVTVADRSQDYEYDSAGSSLDISPLPNPCPYKEGSFINTYEYTSWPNKRYRYTFTFTPASGRLVRTFGFSLGDDDSLVRAFFATNESGPLGILHTRRVDLDTGVVLEDSDRFYTASQSYTIAGKTAYYISDSSSSIGFRGDGAAVGIPDIYWPSSTGDNGKTAWTLIFGNVTEGGLMVPVQWSRTGDGAILETHFDITVAAGGD